MRWTGGGEGGTGREAWSQSSTTAPIKTFGWSGAIFFFEKKHEGLLMGNGCLQIFVNLLGILQSNLWKSYCHFVSEFRKIPRIMDFWYKITPKLYCECQFYLSASQRCLRFHFIFFLVLVSYRRNKLSDICYSWRHDGNVCHFEQLLKEVLYSDCVVPIFFFFFFCRLGWGFYLSPIELLLQEVCFSFSCDKASSILY